MSKKQDIIFDKIWNRSLHDVMSESFSRYAKYIIQDRALPDIRDGLKPVQRRILYAMFELKINYDKPYKKSARTVGEVIGKYHPHGDSSIYEAMVRMSQEWKNNIPLLDMQGNKGSIDGDSAAAMRYTECRLSKFGQLMLEDIQKDTVKFILNFDDSEQEPSILPSLLPNILINGSTGIAAGYATNIPPFNIDEVINCIIHRINNPNCKLDTLKNIIKGPDFPTGGIIQGKKGIDEIFETGKGKFFIRAKIEQEIVKKTKRLIIKEIPFEVNKANLVKSLDEIRASGDLPGFKEVRDDSDKNGISIVLNFETEKDLDVIKTFLYKKTQLQISYNANVVLIKDRKPVLANLIDILDSFIAHCNDIVIKSAIFDLNKALDRKEILEGLIKAISEIDKLVELIKNSKSKDEAKLKIENYFNVNEKQSEAIVNLRLYILTSYDTDKLKKEYEDLLVFINEKQLLINSSEHRNNFICDKLRGYKKILSQKRKSVIENDVEELEVKALDIIKEVHGFCVVTKDNYIKFVVDQKIDNFDLSKSKIKDFDIPISIFNLSTLDYLVCFLDSGKCVTIPAYKIKTSKMKENGIHINDLITIDAQDKTICAFAITRFDNLKTQVLIATENSLIKKITLDELSFLKTPKVFSYISLKTDDKVVSVSLLNKPYEHIISITNKGYAIRYNLNEIPVVGKNALGLRNMMLKPKDKISVAIPVDLEEQFLFFTSNRGAKRIHINDVALSSRSKQGKRIFNQVENNPYLINSAGFVNGRNFVYLLVEDQGIVEFKVSDIPITEINSRMNLINKINSKIILFSFLDANKNILNKSEINNFLTLNENKKKNEKNNKNNLLENSQNYNSKVNLNDKSNETTNIQKEENNMNELNSNLNSFSDNNMEINQNFDDDVSEIEKDIEIDKQEKQEELIDKKEDENEEWDLENENDLDSYQYREGYVDDSIDQVFNEIDSDDAFRENLDSELINYDYEGDDNWLEEDLEDLNKDDDINDFDKLNDQELEDFEKEIEENINLNDNDNEFDIEQILEDDSDFEDEINEDEIEWWDLENDDMEDIDEQLDKEFNDNDFEIKDSENDNLDIENQKEDSIDNTFEEIENIEIDENQHQEFNDNDFEIKDSENDNLDLENKEDFIDNTFEELEDIEIDENQHQEFNDSDFEIKDSQNDNLDIENQKEDSIDNTFEEIENIEIDENQHQEINNSDFEIKEKNLDNKKEKNILKNKFDTKKSNVLRKNNQKIIKDKNEIEKDLINQFLQDEIEKEKLALNKQNQPKNLNKNYFKNNENTLSNDKKKFKWTNELIYKKNKK